LLEREKAYAKAKQALQMALNTNSNLSEVFVLKGSIEIMFEMNFAEAEKSLNKAIELNSNNPDAYHWKSYICICFERFKEALSLENTAVDLDPTSIRFNGSLTKIFFFSGDYNKTIIQSEELLEFDEKALTSYLYTAFSYAQLGFFELAFKNIDKAVDIRRSTEILLNKAYIYGLAGNLIQAETIFRQVLDESSSQIDYSDVALVHSVLGDFENAFECLYKALGENSTNLHLMRVDIRFKNLRNDPRFKEFLRKLNLIEKGT